MGWGDVANGTAQAGGGSKGGWGSVANAGVHPDHQQQPHHGGGFFGAIGGLGHWVGQKAGLAGHDIAQIPAGTFHLVKDTAIVATHPSYLTNRRKSNRSPLLRDVTGIAEGAKQSLEHPLRDPFQTALTLSPVLHGVGKVGEAGIEAGGAARAGEGAGGAARAAGKALLRREPPLRTLRQGDKATTLLGSRNAGVRLAQRGYDRMVQHALDREAQAQGVGRVTGRIAQHGAKRVAGALNEEQGIAQRMRAVPANALDAAARRVRTFKPTGRVHNVEHQAALELTSVQTPPEEAAAYHYGQAAKGVNVKQNTAAAKLYERVAKRGLVHVDESKPAGAKVFINPAEEKLARADQALADVQKRGDTILAEKGVRSEQALATRADAPGRIRAGATFGKPTPAKLGVESPALKIARGNAASIDKRATAALAKYGANDARTIRLQSAASVAKDKLQAAEEQAANRVKPTGIVGGETARPGRGYVSYRPSEKKVGATEISRARSAVVGKAQSPLLGSKTFTGASIEKGLIPQDITGAASRHYRQIAKFLNTDEARRAALQTGSDVRRSPRDILLRNPDLPAPELTAKAKQLVGKETRAAHTPETLTPEEEAQATTEGLAAAHKMFVQKMLDKTDESKLAGIGEKAPAGYRWVDENTIKGLQRELAPKGGAGAKVGKVTDNVNSAITSATVYYKIGHIGTRFLTNAATNLMQGSLNPVSMGKALTLWKSLGERDRLRMYSAAGQHGFAALPHEGDTFISRGATKGANFWARRADAMFRFNALSYEFRRAGFTTPEDVRGALDALERNGHGLPAHQWSKISAAARRADREAISYDRLNDFERRFLTRAIWFYPWIKGSTMFTIRSALEHPFKMGLAGNLGVQGRERQLKELGPVPSYEQGLVSLGKGSHPLTTDLSTFSPFATAGNLLNVPQHGGAAAEFLNPAVGAAGQLLYGLNPYGAPSKNPYADALRGLGAATPEEQALVAYLAQHSHKDQSGRMFPKSLRGTLERFLGGPATPRHVNKSALAKAAARERSGQR